MLQTELPARLCAHIKYAQSLAKGVLSPQKETHSSMNSLAYTYGAPYSFWAPRTFFYPFSTTHTVHHHTSPCRKSKKEESETFNLLSGVALSAIALFVTYSFGKDLGHYFNSSRDIRSVKEEQVFTNHYFKNKPQLTDIKNKFEDVFRSEIDLLSLYRSSSRNSLLIKSGVLAGLGTGIYASIIAPNSDLLFKGILLTVGATLAWALKSGFDTSSQQTQREANILEIETNRLINKINC